MKHYLLSKELLSEFSRSLIEAWVEKGEGYEGPGDWGARLSDSFDEAIGTLDQLIKERAPTHDEIYYYGTSRGQAGHYWHSGGAHINDEALEKRYTVVHKYRYSHPGLSRDKGWRLCIEGDTMMLSSRQAPYDDRQGTLSLFVGPASSDFVQKCKDRYPFVFDDLPGSWQKASGAIAEEIRTATCGACKHMGMHMGNHYCLRVNNYVDQEKVSCDNFSV